MQPVIIFNNFIAPIENFFYWLAGIVCTYENKRHAIICVYMPCMSTQSINDDVFLECLGFLAATIEELDCTCITIIGDWNADVSNINTSLATISINFVQTLA